MSLLVFLLVAFGASGQTPDWSQGVTYTYDAAGNVIAIGADTQAYDLLGRLTISETNGVESNFTYDAFGNRTDCQRPGTNCQYGVLIDATTNRIDGADYDAAGNLRELDEHRFSYDVMQMQTSDVVEQGENDFELEYVYTPTDERIAVHMPDAGSWQWSVRDVSGKVLREFTSQDGEEGQLGRESWSWTKDYIWRNGLLLATKQFELTSTAVSTYYYHLDHLGSPHLITNQAKDTVGRHSYHAFGPETSDGINEPSLARMKYTGHERDAELDYMHARYYSAKTGRFLSPDPVLGNLLQPQSWNRYAYVFNNPLNFVDPTGMSATGGVTCDKDGNCRMDWSITIWGDNPWRFLDEALEKDPVDHIPTITFRDPSPRGEHESGTDGSYADVWFSCVEGTMGPFIVGAGAIVTGGAAAFAGAVAIGEGVAAFLPSYGTSSVLVLAGGAGVVAGGAAMAYGATVIEKHINNLTGLHLPSLSDKYPEYFPYPKTGENVWAHCKEAFTGNRGH